MLAEGTGLEPASPCGRRFSRPLHYQLCYPSVLSRLVQYNLPISRLQKRQKHPQITLIKTIEDAGRLVRRVPCVRVSWWMSVFVSPRPVYLVRSVCLRRSHCKNPNAISSPNTTKKRPAKTTIALAIGTGGRIQIKRRR